MVAIIGKYHLKLSVIFLISIFSSCMDDELWKDRNKPNLAVSEVMSDGVIILNEGNFMYGNASLSYYNSSSRKCINDVFYQQNGIPLGDVSQSAVLFKGELFIVMNNSGKVVAVNMGKYQSLNAFEYTHKITGLVSPRYIHFFNETKGYITDLYAKQVYIVNPSEYKIEASIDVDNRNTDFYQHSTEQIIAYKNYVFINCYNFDDKILIIDTETDKLIDSMQVLAQPNSMVMDRNNKIWALCDGGYEGSNFPGTDAGLVRIDPETRTIERIFVFSENSWPSKLTINGSRDTLYYIEKDIWSMPVDATDLPELPLIKASDKTGTKVFYCLAVNPVTSELYAGDAIDYVQEGIVYRYSSQGIPMDTIPVGIAPGFIYFPVSN
jgi:hypothetical protein